jgi:predicted metal-binding protein
VELTRYTRKLKEKGATYCKVIPVSRVVTAEWVRLKCQFGCGAYGTRLSCPPFSPTPSLTKSMLKDFSEAIFVAFKIPGSASERASRRGKRKIIVSVERELFLDGYYSAFAMAFGPCNLCASCDLTAACKYPDYARPSMEACGIDVYATARNAGFPLKVVRSYDEGCVYCGLILVGKRQSGAGADAGRLPRTRAKAASKKEKRNAAK